MKCAGVYIYCEFQSFLFPPPLYRNHFFSQPPRGLYGQYIFEACRADTSTRPEGPSHLWRVGGGGRGPPENFLKIGFKIVLYQSNFEHIWRNIAAYNTLYTNSSIYPFLQYTSEARRAQPLGGSGGPWPPGNFVKIVFKMVLFQSNLEHIWRNIAVYWVSEIVGNSCNLSTCSGTFLKRQLVMWPKQKRRKGGGNRQVTPPLGPREGGGNELQG